MSHPLAEREGDLAVLDHTVDEARARRGAVVLLSGEAGIGKSALLQAWLEDLAGDVLVRQGWCDDFLTTHPLGPFRDIARQIGGDLAEAVRTGDTATVLQLLLEELGNPLHPTVLVVEDVHWADEASLDVLRFVARRIESLPAVLAVSYRETELEPDHPLRRLVGTLVSPAVHRIRPHPLSRRAVERLIAGAGLDPDEVLRVTGGNPFFVTEITATGGVLPASVADVVVGRLQQLRADSRAAVEFLAVIPGSVGPGLAAEAGPAEALAAAERAGLLVVEPHRVRFRHELARRAVLAAMPAVRRIACHHQVLEWLVRSGAGPGVLLPHAVGAGRLDAVATYGPAAADAATHAGAHRQAAGIQEELLRHPGILDAEAMAGLLEQRAWTLQHLHRPEEALAAAEDLARLRSGDLTAAGRALVTVSRMAWLAGQRERAGEAIEEAARLLDGTDDVEARAELAVNRLSLIVLMSPGADVLTEAEEALTIAEVSGRPDLESLALTYRGIARTFVDDQRAIDDLRLAIDVAERGGSDEPAGRARINLVRVLLLLRVPDAEFEAAYEDASSYADRHDQDANRHYLDSQRATFLMDSGAWREATAEYARLLADDPGGGVRRSTATTGVARIAARRGDVDADDLLAAAWELATATGGVQYITRAMAARIEHAWLSGRPDDVAGFLDEDLLDLAPPADRGAVLRFLQLSGHEVEVPDGCPEPYRSALTGDWRTAAAVWERRRQPYERALELAASGDPEATLEAIRILDDLGAAPAARLARRSLRDLGISAVPRGPQSTTRANPAGLTERQLEVLRLVAAGLTNADIADRLVVSVRTVDHHVSAILQKLGVATRQEAAARFEAIAGAPASSASADS